MIQLILERFFTLLVAYHEGLSKTARELDPALLRLADRSRLHG